MSPCPFRSATSLGTARCHHVPSPAVPHPGLRPWALPSATTLQKCHIQGHYQVPPCPFSTSATPRGTAKCHHSPQVPHPGSLPSATTSCPNSATSVVTSLGTPGATTPLLQKCHTQCWPLGHCQVPPRPPLALSHPGSLPWTLPGATPSSPRDLGGSLVPRGLLTLPAGPAGIGSGTRSRAQVTPRWLLVTPRWLLVAPGLPHGRWGS